MIFDLKDIKNKLKQGEDIVLENNSCKFIVLGKSSEILTAEYLNKLNLTKDEWYLSADSELAKIHAFITNNGADIIIGTSNVQKHVYYGSYYGGYSGSHWLGHDYDY